MLFRRDKAFTLVELIVVITILSILGTIGFVSLQGYTKSARDSVRISDIKSLTQVLNVYQTKNDSLPLPDAYIEITGGGSIYSYQGYFGTGVALSLGQAAIPQDPLLDSPYIYSVTPGQTKFQFLRFMEENIISLSIQDTLAENSLEGMYPVVSGSPIGILLALDNTTPSLDVDFLSDNTVYKYLISNTQMISGTGASLARNSGISSCKRIQELSSSTDSGIFKINPDGSGEIEVYCDMESTGGAWTLMGFFNKEGLGYSVSSTGSSLGDYNTPGWKFSDSLINSVFQEYVKLEAVGTLPCDEYLFCTKFDFNYSAPGGANYQTRCSQNIDGTFQDNYYWNSGYPISHWGARDVWLRNNNNDGTRWMSSPGNKCGYTAWYNEESYSASPDIRFWVR